MKKSFFAVLLSASVLAGCGQTGPLTLPTSDSLENAPDNTKKKTVNTVKATPTTTTEVK